MKKYTINGKIYTQRTLVLGQIKQLMPIIERCAITGGTPLPDVICMFGDLLPAAAAVVLQPDGVSHAGKDLDAMATEFAEYLDIATAEQVIDDFFDLTPAATIAALLGRLRGMFEAATVGAKKSIQQCSSSPAATLPSETASFGDTL